MDNFRLSVGSEGEGHFKAALRLAFDHSPGQKATHYRVTKEYGLIFYWTDPKKEDVKELPYVMDYDAAVSFAWNWLKTADYGHEPDHDGDNGEGFLIFNEDWGHVDHDHYAFVAIKPMWAMYGK